MEGSPLRRYELQTELFKALAHPMRLHMLERLRIKPWCVCELAAAVGVDKSVASKHLSQLRRAGLIEDEKRGTLVEYRLVAPCVLELAACAESAILRNRRRQLEERGDGAEALPSLAAPPSHPVAAITGGSATPAARATDPPAATPRATALPKLHASVLATARRGRTKRPGAER